tara:strand:- start:1089 stop:1280 length:192 start_codon:yes stop_codon:yes gene_type:complete
MEEFWYNFAVAFAMAPIVLGVLAWMLIGLTNWLEEMATIDVLDLWYFAMALVMLLGVAGIMTL